MSAHADEIRRRFRTEYAAHRASEGRGRSVVDARTLPYVTDGPLARQWTVRARSWEAFEARVLRPARARADARAAGPLRLLDLGAGNGWLAHRAACAGAESLALDLRCDAVDGLGAAPDDSPIARVTGSFEALPLRDASFDVVVFNASLHYAEQLGRALAEARRVARRGARIVVLDSPFYPTAEAGEEMMRAKRLDAVRRFGARADALLAIAFVEYLTRARLVEASRGLGLGPWRRHRVWYPLWYELRGVRALLRGERVPSRFDLWEATAA
ncbi:MAG TPA: methyltransferase domain-containing protein [Gemmatimonadaceae bacterium]|jgi:SAM-dependent methyltransferase|nr:methyltransferase domain-containing protein [Gemmatimonadaceae bacterium]